jgi:hypothetical protein
LEALEPRDGAPVHGNASGISRISEANEAATRAALRPHLDPEEEVAAFVAARPKAGKLSTMWGPRIEVTPGPIELPELCALAISARRFFIVSQPRDTDEGSRLLYTVPLDAVRSVQVAPARGAKELSWTANGARYVLWSDRRVVTQFAEALQSRP